MLKIIYPTDNWILQKIGQILTSSDIKSDKEITYYINWKYWQYVNNCKKSACDIVFFTHFEAGDNTQILDTADYIFCMSEHGGLELLKRGISEHKIKVIGGFGLSAQDRKIRLGIAGRPYKNGRKGEYLLSQLAKKLDGNVFEFVFERNWNLGFGRVSNNFINDIDYLLVTSIIEGGSMDMLNAKALNIPVISRDIGFIYSLKDNDDLIFEDENDLLDKLKIIELKVKSRKELLKKHTWNNFVNWHKGIIREIEKDSSLYSDNK